MPSIDGTQIIAPVVPPDTTSTHPSHVDEYGKGGYRAVANATDRDAIPAARRSVGMLVRLNDTGVGYVLGADLTTWTVVPLAITNLRGPLSARPAASAANAGFTYETTDVGARTVTRSDGSAWDELPVVFRDRASINVKDYGAVGDGVTDDYAAIMASITAAGSGGVVYFPSGTYYSASRIVIPTSIHLRGESRKTVTILLNKDLPLAVGQIYAAFAPFSAYEITFDGDAPANGLNILHLGHAAGVSIVNCDFMHPYLRQSIGAGWVNDDTANHGEIEIRGCNFYDGVSAGGIALSVSADVLNNPQYGGIGPIVIDGCRFINVGSSGISAANTYGTNILADRLKRKNTFTKVTISNNTFEMNDTGVYSAIPCEMAHVTNCVIDGNIVSGASRGLSCGGCTAFIYKNNIIRDQFYYACEMSACEQALFSGNTIINCATFITDTSITAVESADNITIIGNSFEGGNNSVIEGTPYIGSSAFGDAKGWKVLNNTFKNIDYCRFVIAFAGQGGTLSGRHVVQGNTYESTSEYACASFFNGRGQYEVCKNNTLLLTQDITTNNWQVANGQSPLAFGYDVTKGYTLIDGNIIRFTGAIVSGGISALGQIAGATSTPGVIITNNRVEGTFTNLVNFNSTDATCEFTNNDFTKATGAIAVNAAIVYKQQIYSYSGSAAPAGTFVQGDVVANTAFAVGGIGMWKRTTSDVWEPVYFPYADGAAGTVRSYDLRTAGVLRWKIICSADAESGSDAGSRFFIGAYTDAGALIDYPFQIRRGKSTREMVHSTRYVNYSNPNASALEVTYNAASGQNVFIQLDEAAAIRWRITKVGTSCNLEFRSHDASSAIIDTPVTILNALNGLITLARPLKFVHATAAAAPGANEVTVGGGDIQMARTTDATARQAVAGDDTRLSDARKPAYVTGAGGAVTQDTGRTTGVTINKLCGAITLVSAAGSTSWQTFTVTNSTVAATDVVHVCQKSGTDLNLISVTAVAAGSFNVTFATTGGTTTEQPVFNFAVVKAVAA
jgi:hypothetical protein